MSVISYFIELNAKKILAHAYLLFSLFLDERYLIFNQVQKTNVRVFPLKYWRGVYIFKILFNNIDSQWYLSASEKFIQTAGATQKKNVDI